MSFHASYLRNLLSIAIGREPERPLLFSYYLTHRCPLSCRYCSDGEGNPFKATAVRDLDTGAAKRLITLLSRSADTLDLTGGEPMLRTDLEDLIDHARGLGMRTVLNTKGIGLAGRPGLMRTDVLVLSVDSLNANKLAEICGCSPDSAQQAFDAPKFAIESRSRNQTQVVLSTVATPQNLDDTAEVFDFAMRNRLGFHLSPQIDGVRVHPDLVNHPGYVRVVDKLIECKNSAAGVLGIRSYLQRIRNFDAFRCHPLLMPVIRPDGKLVYPCVERPLTQVDMFEAGNYRNALRQAKAQVGPLPPCRDCCHIFCHMALSLLQRHPIEALGEGRHWTAIKTGACA